MFHLLIRQEFMNEAFISLVGMAAAILTTSSFMPQIVKGYRTKKMDDVSPYLMSLFMTGTILWTAYGVYRADLVIIIANTVATILNAILLYFKFSYQRRPVTPI